MAASETLKIGIIGFGPFGQFLARTMIKQGHTLVATSRSDHSLLCFQLGIPFFKEFSKFFASGSDVILLCTSIVSTSDVLSTIPMRDLQKARLFVDVLSVKEHPRDLLLQVLPEEVDLLCTHPMFGPESGRDGWEGLPLVYDRVRVRNHGLCDKFLDVFHQEGCRMLEMSCEEHDRMTAKTQFLAHTIGRMVGGYYLMCLITRGPASLSVDWPKGDSNP
ncbi:arogenate dehydrogenase 1, chloroplastic-like isoform X2 [Phalaenopsis equestris]|uniref:arogenate dehydrogenase 1, chloroplastic-like isoform X2 n=1 Tax=Phalaenopsis equestris TaxID=78828 RepID=UPI0009E3AA36|nr:arogenate dehydrogenase 1, chloroplastic-like isoform X2 [Phalaenopsis equestris]